MRLQWLAGIAMMTVACAPGTHPSTSSTSASSGALVTSPRVSPTSTPPPAKDYATPTPLPASAGPYVGDLTWVSDSMGWALVQVPCAEQLCPGVAETTNGGVTWQGLPSLPVSRDTAAVAQGDCEQADPCVSHTRFATSKIGYLFGPALFMTVDGGESWQALVSPPIETLEATGGYVFRVVYDNTGCPGPCNRTVEEAPAGSNTWHTLLQIPEGGDLDTATLILQGSQTIYLPIYGNPAGGGIGDQEATFYRSLDGGQSWQHLSDPCAAAVGDRSGTIAFAAAPEGYLAALCEGVPGWAVLASTDEGSTWGPLLSVPGSYVGLIATPGAGTLVIASAPVAGGGPDTSTLWISTDGGRSWSAAATDQVNLNTAPLGASLYLGFEDAMTGRWVGDDQTIWTTTDGGTDWTARPFAIG